MTTLLCATASHDCREHSITDLRLFIRQDAPGQPYEIEILRGGMPERTFGFKEIQWIADTLGCFMPPDQGPKC